MELTYKNKSKTRLYGIWNGMIMRCSNPRVVAYKNYGGRGISVCDEWRSSDAFISWALSNGYEDQLQIDRIDNDGDYCPENCRWVTPAINSRNRRVSRIIKIDDEQYNLVDLAAKAGISVGSMHRRLAVGCSEDELLLSPAARRSMKVATINGISRTLKEWESETGIPDSTLSWRMTHNWPEHKLLLPSRKKNGGNRHVH